MSVLLTGIAHAIIWMREIALGIVVMFVSAAAVVSTSELYFLTAHVLTIYLHFQQ